MNNNSKIKILFFTPFAGYTGSEVMLFNMLKHIDLQKFEVAIFSIEKGELLSTLPSSIKTYWCKKNAGFPKRLKNKILKVSTGKSALETQIMNVHNGFKPDLWYLNTLLLSEVAEIAQRNQIKYAVHFHELQSQYKYLAADKMQAMIGKASFNVGCCECVCDNLKTLGAYNIEKQYECFDSALIKADSKEMPAIKGKLKIPDGHKVIIMAGQRTDRKGIDIFINTAKEMRDKPYFFLWLGAKQNSAEELFFERYIAHHKLVNIALIHPPREEYFNYLTIADIFFLSSREDPFPIVMLEAGFLGKYIVALNSGGVKEFVTKDTGYIIDSWNVSDIANKLHECIQQQSSIGMNIKSKEEALKFDVLVQVKLFEKILLNEIPIEKW